MTLDTTLYFTDYNLWLEQTAALLHQGKVSKVDRAYLMEEIEGLAKRDKRALRSHLIQVIKCLLQGQVQAQTGDDQNGWRRSVAENRTQLQLLLEDSPSLRSYLDEVLEDGYNRAIMEAKQETAGAGGFYQVKCPFTVAEILGE